MRINKLTPIDEFSFEIEWSDGIIHIFELGTLQSLCPCIRCHHTTPTETTATTGVTASSIRSVGNYAIQIQFRSGCSKGIFPYTLLRALAEKKLAGAEGG